MSLSADGLRAALLRNSATHVPEVFTDGARRGRPAPATSSNPGFEEYCLAPQEVVRFKARDGLELEGLLVRPLDEKKGQRYPLILYVHGGPSRTTPTAGL